MNLFAMLNIEDLDKVIKLLEDNNWDERAAANAYMAQQMAGGMGDELQYFDVVPESRRWSHSLGCCGVITKFLSFVWQLPALRVLMWAPPIDGQVHSL